jgi:hypothetical protein
VNIQVQPDAKAVTRRLPFEVVALVLKGPSNHEGVITFDLPTDRRDWERAAASG